MLPIYNNIKGTYHVKDIFYKKWGDTGDIDDKSAQSGLTSGPCADNDI